MNSVSESDPNSASPVRVWLHDISTHLTNLTGFLQLLADPILTDPTIADQSLREDLLARMEGVLPRLSDTLKKGVSLEQLSEAAKWPMTAALLTPAIREMLTEVAAVSGEVPRLQDAEEVTAQVRAEDGVARITMIRKNLGHLHNSEWRSEILAERQSTFSLPSLLERVAAVTEPMASLADVALSTSLAPSSEDVYANQEHVLAVLAGLLRYGIHAVAANQGTVECLIDAGDSRLQVNVSLREIASDALVARLSSWDTPQDLVLELGLDVGLGVFIAGRLVDAMEGTIEIQPGSDGVATIRLTIPNVVEA